MTPTSMMKRKLRLLLLLLCAFLLVGCLMARISWVELGQDGGWDTFQHLFREDTQQLPSDVQGLENGAVLVVTLRKWK
jgi:hypothetical protein